MSRFILIILNFLILNSSTAQSNFWEVYGGVSYSNVMHIYLNQQITYNHTLNAPFWNFGYQSGVNRSWHINPRLSLTTGVRLQLKGDKNSGPTSSIRFSYGALPVNLKYKILSSKNIFLKAGLSGNYLISMGAYDTSHGFFDEIKTFNDRLGLSGQFGFNFNIISHLSAELMYSQDFTNIAKELPILSLTEDPFYYRNQAFELTIIYRL